MSARARARESVCRWSGVIKRRLKGEFISRVNDNARGCDIVFEGDGWAECVFFKHSERD